MRRLLMMLRGRVSLIAVFLDLKHGDLKHGDLKHGDLTPGRATRPLLSRPRALFGGVRRSGTNANPARSRSPRGSGCRWWPAVPSRSSEAGTGITNMGL